MLMTDFAELRLLVLADPHVALASEDMAAMPETRRPGLGLELLRRAIDDARNRGGFDAIAIMGDIVNDGDSPDAAETIKAVAHMMRRAAGDVPLLVVPGNHDGNPDRLLAAFDATPGAHEIAGYQFFVFADRYTKNDTCTRSPADEQVFVEYARRTTAPLIVLQHNPMNPVIDDPYPYMLTNRRQVMTDYSSAGVLLSLSGHYHKGQPATTVDGVTYFTAPAVCEGSLPYALVTLHGRDVSIETRSLTLPADLALIDGHTHTEFAYCGQNMSADGAIARARTIGLAGLRLIEHAPQTLLPARRFLDRQPRPQPVPLAKQRA